MQFHLPVVLTAGSEYRVSVAAMSHAFLDTYVPSCLVYDEGTMDFRAGASICSCDRIFYMQDFCGVENTTQNVVIEKI